jgi:hypothetical protein
MRRHRCRSSAKSHGVIANLRQAKRQTQSRRATGIKNRMGRRIHFSAKNRCEPFVPPENWYESSGESQCGESQCDFQVVVQSAGEGYTHIVTPEQVRERLARLPGHLLEPLKVVQLSRMTRKKKSYPCYGMQWGSTLYLYPLEDSLEEYFDRPPGVDIVNESKMYGGRWDRPSQGAWRLTWSRASIEDFYLNNILIHELGHLNDDRNNSYADRERYAEWFAIEYGYNGSGGGRARRSGPVRRRHHAR